MDAVSTHDIVVEVLRRASSQDPEILKPAEAKLREWETQPGFYTILFVCIFLLYDCIVLIFLFLGCTDE